MLRSITKEEHQLADRIAYDIGSRWQTIEIEDLNSHLYLWLYEHQKQVARFRLSEGDGELFVSLKREAIKYCAAETAKKINRPLDADKFYNREMIKRTLPYLFEGWPEIATSVNPVTDQPLGNGSDGEVLAILLDLRSAFIKLNQSDQTVLRLKFADGLTLNEIGEIRGLAKTSIHSQIDKALGRMVLILGEISPN